MNWTAIPSFERLPLRAIYRRNPGRRGQMYAAAVAAVEEAIRAGFPESEWDEIAREALRPFDLYAHQRGELQ